MGRKFKEKHRNHSESRHRRRIPVPVKWGRLAPGMDPLVAGHTTSPFCAGKGLGDYRFHEFQYTIKVFKTLDVTCIVGQLQYLVLAESKTAY
jgi:hypothetical protein